MFKKNIKPVLLAGALALATAVSPVFAEETTNSISVTKTAEFASGFNTVDGEFSFTVTPYSYYTYKNSDGKTDEETYNKNTNSEKFPTYALDNIIIDYDANGTFAASKSESQDLTFTKTSKTIPGVYVYKVQEDKGTDTKWTYDETVYYVYVTVKEDGGVKITQVETKDDATMGNKKGAITFENQYTENATFEVGKTVTGEYGDKTKDFAFSIQFTEAAHAPDTEIVGTVYNGDVATATTYTFEYGKAKTVNLKDGQTIKFDAIPVGTTYYVTETVAGDNGYTSTYVQTSNKAEGQSTSADKQTAVTGIVYDDKAGDKVQFTNDKAGNIVTGIITNNAPYIVLLGASGAGLAALAGSKKRSKK